MNIQQAMEEARKTNRAIRGSDWPDGLYMYHGMDNSMWYSTGREAEWSVAALLRTDYETTNLAPYHGPLDRKRGVVIPCDGCGFRLLIPDEHMDEIAAGVWGTIPCPKCKASLNNKIKEILQ
jgi:hypothetical protein